MQTLLTKARQEMEEVLTLAMDDINSVRIGRAKPSLVQDIKVAVYGSTMTVKELATISAPDPQTLLIKPWDVGIIEDLQKGLMRSSLGYNPAVDGQILRIKIPPLTSEQRQELARLVDQKAESSRVMVRQARSSSKEEIEAQKGEAGVSEDDIHLALATLQKLTDEYIAKVDELASLRKTEITTL